MENLRNYWASFKLDDSNNHIARAKWFWQQWPIFDMFTKKQFPYKLNTIKSINL